MRTDPTGRLDDWIKDNETGDVFWDESVKSAGQLETEGGYSPQRYSYIGSEYQLPDGSGSLNISTWAESGLMGEGIYGLIIDWKLTSDCSGRMTAAQTFSSNVPDYYGPKGGSLNDVVESPIELIDGADQKRGDDLKYNRSPNVISLMTTNSDSPGRQSSSVPVTFYAQTTPVIVNENGQIRQMSSATFSWGYTIYPNGSVEYQQPKIVKPTSLHSNLLKNVPKE